MLSTEAEFCYVVRNGKGRIARSEFGQNYSLISADDVVSFRALKLKENKETPFSSHILTSSLLQRVKTIRMLVAHSFSTYTMRENLFINEVQLSPFWAMSKLLIKLYQLLLARLMTGIARLMIPRPKRTIIYYFGGKSD